MEFGDDDDGVGGSGECESGIFGMVELRRRRNGGGRAPPPPTESGGPPEYIGDVFVGGELKFTKPQDPVFRSTGRVAAHHLGERQSLVIAGDAEGLGARKGKAKKKKRADRPDTRRDGKAEQHGKQEKRMKIRIPSHRNCISTKFVGGHPVSR